MADPQLFETGAGQDDTTAGRTAVPPEEGPLPVRLRPTTLADFVGQEHILAPGGVLRRALEEGRPHSMLLYGPPGSGKTTLARLLASAAEGYAYEELSAVEVGRPEVRKVIERAQHRRQAANEATLLFLDEIHRFNKAQQDALLPAVEEGLITLIGATTENPYFEVNSALLSRLHVYELHALEPEQVASLLRRADPELDDEVVEFLAARSAGDARAALSALELAEEAAGDGPITLDAAEDSLQRKALRYDKDRDQHYDTISAFIKSLRGSDPDAALYYLAVMLEGGEDPRFIARRIIVQASEDVGNADPNALVVAVSAAHAVEHVGLPECQFALAQASIYLARAPKSDEAKRAVFAARDHVRREGAQLPPAYLRSSAGGAGRPLGRGVGYENPHRNPDKRSRQEHLPPGLEGTRFVPEPE